VVDHYKLKRSAKDPVQRTISKLFLNSLYGRMGMKEIDTLMRIVDKKEAELLDKNTNVTIISELGSDKFMVRYSGKLTDNIRKIYFKDPLISESEIIKDYSMEEIKKAGFNKSKNIPSAVHIAAAISSYARIIINEYKNIPGNPCIMSDTDSVVLTKPLSNKYVGNNLGQIKLEYETTKGIFIQKKLYCIITSKGQEIIKSSGIDSSKLNYDYFLKLLKGETVEVERTSFNVD
jgi:hypothetical protein